MKLKLTNELAELIGFWKLRRTRQSVGVFGDLEAQQKFANMVLKQRLVPPEKIVGDERAIWFSHHKIKTFFLDVLKDQNELFGRKNNLSAAFLRGLYLSDGEGSFIRNATFKDRLLIEHLGFYTKQRNKDLYIRNIENFLKFIKFKPEKSGKQSENIRK